MAKETKGKPNINNHILDIITPPAMEINRQDILFGDQLGRVVTIINYPPRAPLGWLSRVANMEGVVCNIHLEPAAPDKLIDNINRSIGELSAQLNAGLKNALAQQRTEQKYEDAKKLLKKIDAEQENVFYMTVSILVLASDRDALVYRTKKVESALAGSHMRGRTATLRQSEGLMASSPYGECPDTIKQMCARNMPISTICGSFPFASSGLNDGTGFIFGKDKASGLILLDLWKRGGDRINSNWTILGDPGVGKSTAVKHIFLNEYSLGTKIIVIDPEREYKDLCKSVEGQWINCGGGKGGRINPFHVMPVPMDDEDDDEEEEALFVDEGKGVGPLALHFQTLRTLFRLYLKDMTDLERSYLEEEIEKMYFDKGMTYNIDDFSVYKNEDFPIMEELYRRLERMSEDETLKERRREVYENLAALIRSMAIGHDSAIFNGHTTINPTSDFIVLDTHNLQESDESVLRAQYFNILRWTWGLLTLDRQERVLLNVDEAYLLVDPQVPQTLKYLRNISKRIRKYNGGLAVITHSVVDFLDPSVKRFGQALLDNPCYKFLMGTDGQNLEEQSKLFNLTEAEQDMLAKKVRGKGLLFAGSKRLEVKVDLAEFELEFFGKAGGA